MNEDYSVLVCTCPFKYACSSCSEPFTCECEHCVYCMDKEDLPE